MAVGEILRGLPGGPAGAGRLKHVLTNRHRGNGNDSACTRKPTRFDLWAPEAQASRCSPTAGVPDDPAATAGGAAGWWTAAGAPAAGDVDYGYLRGRRRHPAAGPAVPPPARGRARALPHLRRRTPPVGGRPVGGPGAQGRRHLRTARGHLHRRGNPGRRGREAATTWPELGVDFVELLPVNGFNGTHNWGYDGVLWYAVHEGYGGPAAYQRFVDAAHAAGLGVIQDVVYNHLGPSGNYLPRFGPYLKSGEGNTWGDSVNLDGPDSDEVRRYILDNAAMWLRDYHVDGLRLDAVHAFKDERAVHLLEDFGAARGRRLGGNGPPGDHDRRVGPEQPAPALPAGRQRLRPGRAVERRLPPRRPRQRQRRNHRLLRRLRLARGAGQGPGDAASSTTAATPASAAGTTAGPSTRPWSTPPRWWSAARTTTRSATGPPATGCPRRLGYGQLALAAVATLTSPFTPMLFMGEEYGATTPWQFFTSHPEPELGKATAEGRIREFERMGWDPAVVPDPQDPETFTRSKLDWAEAADGGPRPAAGAVPGADRAAPHDAGPDGAWLRGHRRRTSARTRAGCCCAAAAPRWR